MRQDTMPEVAKTTTTTTTPTTALPSPAPFDPNRFLVNLRGRPYLEVKYRLLWLRSEHPEAVVHTELMAHDRERRWALFRATVTVVARGPDGPVLASATGWGQEDAQGFGDYLEKAETKALGRALAALGYGTQFCEDHEAHEFGAAIGPPAPAGVDAPAGPGRGPARPTSSPATQRPHNATDKAGSRGEEGEGGEEGEEGDGGLSAAIRALGGTEIGRVAAERVAVTPAGEEVYLVDGRVHATRHHSPKAGTYYRAVATCPHGHKAYPMARIGQDGTLTPWRHRLPDGSLCTAPDDWTTRFPKFPGDMDLGGIDQGGKGG
jgi:hypothetical protein